MPKKTPKSVKLVKDYLLKILDRGHHRFYRIELELSPEELEDWRCGNAPSIDYLIKAGRALVTEHSDWDKYLNGRGQKGTLELIERDINIYRVVEDFKNKHALSTEKAIIDLEQDCGSNFGVHLSIDQLKSIYKSYVEIFRLGRKEIKDHNGKIVSWVQEDPFLNFPMREEAAYALREMKVIWGHYPISRPEGIFEGIHKLLNLPFEEDIEKEVPIYQLIRNKSFGLTYADSSGLRWLSMGSFATTDRLDNRADKIKAALRYAEDKYDINAYNLKEIYRHYGLIEAEINGQDRGQIFYRLEKDLKS